MSNDPALAGQDVECSYCGRAFRMPGRPVQPRHQPSRLAAESSEPTHNAAATYANRQARARGMASVWAVIVGSAAVTLLLLAFAAPIELPTSGDVSAASPEFVLQPAASTNAGPEPSTSEVVSRVDELPPDTVPNSFSRYNLPPPLENE